MKQSLFWHNQQQKAFVVGDFFCQLQLFVHFTQKPHTPIYSFSANSWSDCHEHWSVSLHEPSLNRSRSNLHTQTHIVLKSAYCICMSLACARRCRENMQTRYKCPMSEIKQKNPFQIDLNQSEFSQLHCIKMYCSSESSVFHAMVTPAVSLYFCFSYWKSIVVCHLVYFLDIMQICCCFL